jgi:hypothetical protein
MLKKLKTKKNQKGFATIEMIPIMVVIALLLNFALGFYGIVQTGILNSVAARNYAFETFRNRTNLVYFHDTRADGNSKKFNSRVHGIASEFRASGSGDAQVTLRRIGFGLNPQNVNDSGSHEPGPGDSRGIFGIKQNVRNDSIESAPVWVRPMYGLCLNAKCSQ